MVGAAVVSQAFVVETLSQGIAPVSVVGTDGSAHGVRFGFTYQSGTVGIHQVLQHAGSGVVTRNKEHLHARLFGFGLACLLLAQHVPLRFIKAIGFHLFAVRFHQRVVQGFSQPAHPGQRSFAGSGRSDDKGLQARKFDLAAIDKAQQPVEGGSEYSQCSQQQDVPLGGRFAAVHHLLQEERPPIFRETGQRDRGFHIVFSHVRVGGCEEGLQVLQVCKFLVETHACQLGQMKHRS